MEVTNGAFRALRGSANVWALYLDNKHFGDYSEDEREVEFFGKQKPYFLPGIFKLIQQIDNL